MRTSLLALALVIPGTAFAVQTVNPGAPHGGSTSRALLPATLEVYCETDPGGIEIHANLSDANGGAFALVAHAPTADPLTLGTAVTILGFGKVDPSGNGKLAAVVSDDLFQGLTGKVAFSAIYGRSGKLQKSTPADLVLNAGIFCDRLDFNYTLGDDAQMVAGRVIDSQWTDAGINVSANNANPAHPDTAILFDSANPTGNDDDLLTPNPGSVGNTAALGKVLIIAENGIDSSPADGLIDVPDDEAFGGSLIFDFTDGATICSATLIDIDEAPGTELRFYRNDDLVTPDEVIPILTLGDNSVQVVNFFESDVDRFEVFFAGSGALGPIQLIPCPQVINFDETSTGIPLTLQAGQWITGQFQNIGVNISVTNLGIGPDKAILFDSENPTGGDTDLLTPNPNVPGNDTPLGLVLIIAENDVDTDPADGLVDDPDDEAGGGQILYTFDYDVTFISARVLDVDGNEIDFFRFFDENDVEIANILIPDLPDGNVQLIQGPISGVRKIRLDLGGSGAMTRLRFCPDEDVVD